MGSIFDDFSKSIPENKSSVVGKSDIKNISLSRAWKMERELSLMSVMHATVVRTGS